MTMDPTLHCVGEFANSVSIVYYVCVSLNGPCQVRFAPIGSILTGSLKRCHTENLI